APAQFRARAQLFRGAWHHALGAATGTAVPAGLARPHRLRPALFHLPAGQLLSSLAERALRVGRDRWRGHAHGFLPDRAAAVGAGPGLAGHLPVPVDLERPLGSPDLRWWAARGGAADGD